MSTESFSQENQIFKEELIRFFSAAGKETFKVPQIGGKELNLHKLFTEVVNRGGYEGVSHNKQWKDIVSALELPPSCTSASFTLKNHYMKCLYEYELHYFKAGKPEEKAAGKEQLLFKPATAIHPRSTEEQRFLGKKVIKPNQHFSTFYRADVKQPAALPKYPKKIRLFSSVPSAKKIVLAFESHCTAEIVKSLNILLIFSSNGNNPHCTLLFENQPYLLESLTNYLYHCINNINMYHDIFEFLEGQKQAETRLKEVKKGTRGEPPLTFKFLEKVNSTVKLPYLSKMSTSLEEQQIVLSDQMVDLECDQVTEYELNEHLISILTVIRNMSFTKSNEPPIVKNTKLMNLVLMLIIRSNNEEVKLNCLEILCNVSKHVLLNDIRKVAFELLESVQECLMVSKNATLNEVSLECLRRLSYPSGNEEFLERMNDSFIEELVNLLLSAKTEVRERAVELLFVVSDQSNAAKMRIASTDKSIQRLVGLVCSNNVEKISKYAACTLSNLVVLPGIQKMIAPFEKELFLTATVDQAVSKIVMGILAELYFRGGNKGFRFEFKVVLF